MERISTGVYGLDELIEGGYFKGSCVLITGKTGTGKTLFSASFVYSGALLGEKAVYITTEETEEDLIEDVQSTFKDWYFKEQVENGLIKVVSIKPVLLDTNEIEMSRFLKLYIHSILENLKKYASEEEIKRVVIDSVSMIELFLKDPYIAKVGLSLLIDALKKLKVTSILTGTIEEGSEKLSGSGIIEFIVDGVIKLDFVPVTEEFQRTLVIRKMRRTNHSTLVHPFQITPSGIRVLKPEEISEEMFKDLKI